MSIELGKFNTLRVVKEVDFGMYLDGGEEGEILLPSRYVPENCKPGDELTVFIYLDNEERLVATTLTPLVQVGEFACLEVAWMQWDQNQLKPGSTMLTVNRSSNYTLSENLEWQVNRKLNLTAEGTYLPLPFSLAADVSPGAVSLLPPAHVFT